MGILKNDSYKFDINITAENNISEVDLKLPNIIIPIFDGDYNSWKAFKDIFESLIHKNQKIPSVQKMH